MQELVIDKPYVPFPPYHGRLWPRMLGWYASHLLRKQYGISNINIEHSERLAASLSAGHGIVLAPNHSRDEDPLVLSQLARKVGQPMFIMASSHLFRQTRMKAYLLRRAGAFSIFREGVDRAAVNTAVDILESAERPLVIFPEGYIARTNDKLNEMMDGVGLMARTAAKRRAKATPPGKVVVHPVAIRYKFLGDINQVADEVLTEIEGRLSWLAQKQLSLIDRIVKVGSALLSLKEIEYIGVPQSGSIEERIQKLVDAILNPLEDEWAGAAHDGTPNARVKRLRTKILAEMLEKELPTAERDRRWNQLAAVYIANELSHYPPNYVRSNPSPERILETIERFEEDLTDKIRKHGEISAMITVGEAIEVATGREGRGGADGDPLLAQVAAQLTSMLGLASPAASIPVEVG